MYCHFEVYLFMKYIWSTKLVFPVEKEDDMICLVGQYYEMQTEAWIFPLVFLLHTGKKMFKYEKNEIFSKEPNIDFYSLFLFLISLLLDISVICAPFSFGSAPYPILKHQPPPPLQKYIYIYIKYFINTNRSLWYMVLLFPWCLCSFVCCYILPLTLPFCCFLGFGLQ